VNADRFGLVLAALAVLSVLALLGQRLRRRAAQRRRGAQPFRDDWRTALRRHVPLYRRLPGALRAQVERTALVFAARVDFVGCNGLQVTDEMRLVVAVQAALLVVKRNADAYRPLHSVLLYPDAFVVPIAEEDETGVVTEAQDVLAGQSIATDSIVLSWPDVISTAPSAHAHNLVLHECAHFLDHVWGGTLSTASSDAASTWHDTLGAEYARLCRAVESGAQSLIDPYGSADRAEFFAVATEAFFERSDALAKQNPELYAVLREFYGLNPIEWPAEGPTA